MQNLFLWTPFGLSLMVGLISAMVLNKDLNKPMGVPSWDFSRSWASNISVVGGLVTLSALGFLPNNAPTQLLSRTTYAVFLFVFPLLAALAPLVYNFSRRVKHDPTTNTIIAEGKVYMFIVASIFTMWAAVGQLCVQAAIIEELRGKDEVLSREFGLLLEFVFSLVALGLLLYAGRTIVETVKIQDQTSKSIAKLADEALGETHVKRWALL